MLPPNTTLFISDLHLSPQADDLLALFLAFLQGPAQQAKQLYILGDLFNVWAGKDINPVFHTQIQQALKALALQGISLFFMSGNRDFLIENTFLEKAHCQKLPDPYLINLQGIPTLLTHGDILCTQDVAYQRYRRIAQHPLTRFLFLRLPKRLRQKISEKLRAKSQQYQRTQKAPTLDVTPHCAEQFIQRFAVRQLIHGHVHRPHIHDLWLNQRLHKRLVLGDWGKQGSVIISTPQRTSLATFSPANGLTIQQSYPLETLHPITH